MIELFLRQFKDLPGYVFTISLLILVVAFILYISDKDREYRGIKVSAAVFVDYIFLMYCSTLIFRQSHPESIRIDLIPFWNYSDIISGKDPLDKWEVILNVLLFVPIGFLLSSITRGLSRGRMATVLIISILLSVVTESLQYFLHRGLCETDDVIHNTLGCLIGYSIYSYVRKFKSL